MSERADDAFPVAVWGVLAVCAAAQLYLVWTKSFNWDEFLHFSQIYQLRAGTLTQPFQVLHSRILGWAPYVSDNLIAQMRAARLFVWACHLATLWLIFRISRRFGGREGALLAAAAYWTAGYVFTHGFSIRADPLVTVVLMSGLFILTRPRLRLPGALAVGALIGVAGMMTFKAAFYAPAFAAALWTHRTAPGGVKRVALLAAAVLLAAVAAFALVYAYHTAGLASSDPRLPGKSHAALFMRWIVVDMPFLGYVVREAMLAPIFAAAAFASPFVWRRTGLSGDERLALAGFLLPILSILFYRNTFPYYFVFLLAPTAVAIAPVMATLARRYGLTVSLLVLAVCPLVMAIKEPRDVIVRQEAMIDYVHREYPRPVGYLDYSQMIADYPRVLRYLTSGNGLRAYVESGDPIVAREFERGNLPFILANYPLLTDVLGPQQAGETFLPEDLAAIRGNYVHQWNGLWREGKRVPAGEGANPLQIDRPNRFIVDGPPITIDGRSYERGDIVGLAAGPHQVTGRRAADVVLWSGTRLPSPPPDVSDGALFTQF